MITLHYGSCKLKTNLIDIKDNIELTHYPFKENGRFFEKMYFYEAMFTNSTRDIVGHGCDQDQNKAKQKAISELIERYVHRLEKIDNTNLGIACHFDLKSAFKHAMFEYIERICLEFKGWKKISTQEIKSAKLASEIESFITKNKWKLKGFYYPIYGIFHISLVLVADRQNDIHALGLACHWAQKPAFERALNEVFLQAYQNIYWGKNILYQKIALDQSNINLTGQLSNMLNLFRLNFNHRTISIQNQRMKVIWIENTKMKRLPSHCILHQV